MTAPLSGKQKRENMKFLLNELRDTAAFKNDQKRKDQAAQQQMRLKEQKAKGVPPMTGRPTNPEAGPKDKIPALLAPGEAVIPAKAAQKPENKPLIKAMVREGRSDRNLSVPMPKGFMCGTTKVKGYQYGSTDVTNAYGYSQEEIDAYNAQLKEQQDNPPPPKPDVYVDVNKPIEVMQVSPREPGVINTPVVPNVEDTGYGWVYTDKEAINPQGERIPYNTAEQDAGIAGGTMQVVDNKIVPTPEPEPLTNVSQIKNEIPVADPVIPMPTKDDEGNVIPVPETSSTTNIPKDPSGFSKWSNTIGGALKDTYESISDPDKLKGALSSTLETLGFNGRDAARFAMLVGASKALGYDTTQAVRFAGQYTLKASDQRASDERAYDKALATKRLENELKYGKPGTLSRTGKREQLTPAGKNTPVEFFEYKVGGTNEVVYIHPSLKNKDGSPMTRDQYSQQFEKGNLMVPWSPNIAKETVATMSDFQKTAKGRVNDVIETRFGKDEKSNSQGKVWRSQMPTDIDTAAVKYLENSGQVISDADTLSKSSELVTTATEMIVEDVKNGVYKDKPLKTATPYFHKATILRAPGVGEEDFITKEGKQMPANKVSTQFLKVQAGLAGEGVKSASQRHAATIAFYADLKKQYDALPKEQRPLALPEGSSFFYYVEKQLNKK